MYSGVENAGAPNFISTFEVNVPIAQAATGQIYCANATAQSASAIDWATVTGAIAPASVNGVTISP